MARDNTMVAGQVFEATPAGWLALVKACNLELMANQRTLVGVVQLGPGKVGVLFGPAPAKTGDNFFDE